MASKGSIECLVCGGSYATDQRRKHEATGKHQKGLAAVDSVGATIDNDAPDAPGKWDALEAITEGEQEVQSPKVPRPAVDPAVVDAHIATLQAEAQTSEAAPADAPAPKVPTSLFPVEATTIDALMKQVKARAADVRWSEKHTDTDSAEKLAKRRARLAEAQALLDAALMSIPETE